MGDQDDRQVSGGGALTEHRMRLLAARGIELCLERQAEPGTGRVESFQRMLVIGCLTHAKQPHVFDQHLSL